MDERQNHVTGSVGLEWGGGNDLHRHSRSLFHLTGLKHHWTTWVMLQIWGEHVADCLEGTGTRKTHTNQERWMSPYAYPPSIRNPPNHRSGERKLFRNGKVIMYVVHVCGGQRVETTVDQGFLQGKQNQTKPWEPVVSLHCGYRSSK